MRIKVVSITDIAGKTAEYKFGDDFTLIGSDKNSQGKTTLLRIILYGLGYLVPSTKGIGDFSNLAISLELEDSIVKRIERRYNLCHVFYTNNREEKFIVPEQQDQLQGLLFNIENPIVLRNLLGCFYTDQEKGWTLLNRGKTIGNNRFNIEDLISGIVGGHMRSLMNRIEAIKREIKKCENLVRICEYNADAVSSEYDDYDQKSLEYLSKELIKYQHYVNQDKRQIKYFKKIKEENNNLIKLIEDCDLHVNLDDGSRIKITSRNIENFSVNNEYIRRLEIEWQQKLSKHARNLEVLKDEIAKRRTLFPIESRLAIANEALSSVDLDIDVVKSTLVDLKKQRNELGRERRDGLCGQECTTKMYNYILKYAEYLDVKRYIKNTTMDFVFTNDLKGYSGTILCQLSFVFRMAYLSIVEEQYDVRIPIIIDSPRTSEITADSARGMMSVIKKYFPEHQVIIASMYDDFIDDANKIKLNGGVFPR